MNLLSGIRKRIGIGAVAIVCRQERPRAPGRDCSELVAAELPIGFGRSAGLAHGHMLHAIDGSLEVVGVVDDTRASGAYGVVEFGATVGAGVEEHRGALIRVLLLMLADEPQAEILDRVPQQLATHGVAA